MTNEIPQAMRDRDKARAIYLKRNRRSNSKVLLRYLRIKFTKLRNGVVSTLKKAERKHDDERLKRALANHSNPPLLREIQAREKYKPSKPPEVINIL